MEAGHYISVITSRPLEIEIPNRGFPNLRPILFADLISQLYNKEKELKFYRFNFPTEAFGDLFWRGLKRILFRQFMVNPTPDLFKSLTSKLSLTINRTEQLTDDDIREIVNDTLTALNSKKYLLVFITLAPIYGFPILAIDPSDTINNKIYTLLDSEK